MLAAVGVFCELTPSLVQVAMFAAWLTIAFYSAHEACVGKSFRWHDSDWDLVVLIPQTLQRCQCWGRDEYQVNPSH